MLTKIFSSHDFISAMVVEVIRSAIYIFKLPRNSENIFLIITHSSKLSRVNCCGCGGCVIRFAVVKLKFFIIWPVLIAQCDWLICGHIVKIGIKSVHYIF